MAVLDKHKFGLGNTRRARAPYPKTSMRLMAPFTLPAPFKRIRRDVEYGGYCATLVHRDCKVKFRILAESNKELEALLPKALEFWRSRARWFKAFRDFAVKELLSQLNDNLDDGEDDPPVVTANQLKAMLSVPFSVVIGCDWDDERIYFEMSGGKGAALHDHCLEVTGTLDRGIEDGDVVALL